MEPRADDIDEVLQAARNLAEALEACDRSVALRESRRAVDSDPEARAIFERLHRAGRAIEAAMQAGVEPPFEVREELEDARQDARAHADLWELLRAQADYVELLLAVEQIIFRTVPRMGVRLR